jgi:hypothetical protein
LGNCGTRKLEVSHHAARQSFAALDKALSVDPGVEPLHRGPDSAALPENALGFEAWGAIRMMPR